MKPVDTVRGRSTCLSAFPMDAARDTFEESDLQTTAEMARLVLSDEERTRVREAIGEILVYFDQMSAVDISGVGASGHERPAGSTIGATKQPARQPLRPDVAASSADRWPEAAEHALVERAGDSEDGFVTTPSVL